MVKGFEHLGDVMFVGVGLALLALGGRDLRRAAVAAGAAAALALGAAALVGVSDHASAAFAVAAAVWAYDRHFGTALLALAAGLAGGRIALRDHYPADVLAGAALGVAAAVAVRLAPLRVRLERIADRVTGRPAFQPL